MSKCPCGAKATFICECGCLCCGTDPCARGCGGAVTPLNDDLTYGRDAHSDRCLFIERRHLLSEWKLDSDVKAFLKRKSHVYFRIIQDGVQQWEHGYATGDDVVQWG